MIRVTHIYNIHTRKKRPNPLGIYHEYITEDQGILLYVFAFNNNNNQKVSISYNKTKTRQNKKATL